MRFARLALLAALFGALASACGGSSYSCQDLCAASNACPGATKADCAATCSKFSALNAAASCGGQFDAFLSCAGDNQSQICSSSTSTNACSASVSAYTSCVTTFCSAHPSDANCK